MKRVLPVLVGFALLLLSSTEGWSLPPCPGSPSTSASTLRSWTDCFGIFTVSSGDYAGLKYVGEYKRGVAHGQGTMTYADGRVEEGIWEYGSLKYAKKLSPTVTAKKSPTPSSGNNEKELEKLRREIARLKKEKKPKPKKIAKKPSPTVTAEKSTPKVDLQKRLELSRRTQEALQVLGLYSGKLDGIIGARTKSAIQRWQQRNGYPGTGEVTELQLAKLEQDAVTRLAKKKIEPKPVQKVAKRPIVFEKLASDLLESLDARLKVAIQPFNSKKVDLPGKITTGFNNRLVDSLLKKSNFKINIIERAKLEDIWKEAEEFGNADFDKLVKEAGAEVLIIGDLRLRKGGVEISYRGYDLRQGQRGKIIASTRTRNLDFDLAKETSIPVSDELGEVFLQIMKSGGIIANAKKPEEFYANARMYEQKGDSGNARRSYAKFFAFDLDYVDPHLRYQKYLKIQEGKEGAREVYFEMKEDSKSFVTEYASILLFSRKTRIKKLEKFLKKHPEFGPGYFELSKEFSEARLGEQAANDKASEKKNLKKFFELHGQGKVIKYFVDKSMVSKFFENAEERMAALEIFDEKIIKNPISLNPMRTNQGWTFQISSIDVMSELFIRYEGQDKFTSTGFFDDMRDPKTGKKMPNTIVNAPLDLGKSKIYVKYKGRKGEEYGPFEIDFDPGMALIEGQIKRLKQIGGSWATHRYYRGKDIFYMTAYSGCAVDKLMYAWDNDKKLDKEFPIHECNPDNPYAMPPGYKHYFLAPPGTKFLAVQVLFKDGTKSKVGITKIKRNQTELKKHKENVEKQRLKK